MDMKLVRLHIEPPLAVIKMMDPAGNYITVRLKEELLEAFQAAASDRRVRAVVLEGLPSVYSAGAPSEVLLSASGAETTDAGLELVHAPLNCPVPVVAAAQGHAIGGGLYLALYCDVAVLSERSLYGVPFLGLGFTPSLGGTFIVPERLGRSLGMEMLLTSRKYRGAELGRRGAGVAVTRHDRVQACALATAERIAVAPRRTLELFKRQTANETRTAALAAMQLERPGHDATIRSAEGKRQIAENHPAPSFMGAVERRV
ncbi:polyketide synthase [Streptomyces formicae]|uniref:Enoyl-CoA hydratase/isomerase family protein n=1 Tax=Streptomyces formicae TaxID=1616117 RepID=A0ABY3WTI4_9ACTN|nr:polyketide synthase [Streptomyces formicae]UNM14784.1 enoyl-CoA hydratase/isomerase family protein [Streptomyces formicae]